MASSPCVNPSRALRRGKGGRQVLKSGFKYKKGRKKGPPCILVAKGAAAPKKGRKKAAKKTSARKSSGSRPCPKGSFRVRKGKGKGRCRKLTGAAAAAAAGRPMGFMRKRGKARASSGGADFMNWD